MRLLFLCVAFACVQATGQIVLRINDTAAFTIASGDLAKMPRHTAVLSDHGKQVSYEGVLLHDLIARAGFDFGSGMHGKQLSSYVSALGSDGYVAVYALAEVDPTVVDSDIIVADKREGQALAATEGPLRIVAPHDKRAARCVRLLQEIDVVQLRK